MRQFIYTFLVVLIIALSSCRTDFETVASSGKLKFSRDTVYLDTVFSNISSSTYTLKVYNESNDDITIPKIELGKGLSSKYRMTVDGMSTNQGKLFKDIVLLAKDSMFIFIETTANVNDASPTDFLYTDQILFDSSSNEQKVELVTLIQDAVFLYPEKFNDGTFESLTLGGEEIYGFTLDENDPIHGNELVFTNQKPYVIYGFAGVPSGKTVTFNPGARVHFHTESGIIVANGASINVNGTSSATDKLENEIIFEGDRLEPEFSDLPGQWGAIWLTTGSGNNKINHLTIKNATIGLYIQNNDETTVEIKNTQIYNCSNYGILAQTAIIEGGNLVINNAGKSSLACTYGGDYKFTHCTFNNNWNSATQLAVLINNYEIGSIPEVKDLTQATFNNCIIYGSYSNELILNKRNEAVFEYQFNNCLLKFNNTSNSFTNNPEYQFTTDPAHYSNIILNKDPKFFDISLNKFNIDETSSAFEKGNSLFTIPSDITGNNRTSPPDLGAYQSKSFPE